MGYIYIYMYIYIYGYEGLYKAIHNPGINLKPKDNLNKIHVNFINMFFGGLFGPVLGVLFGVFGGAYGGDLQGCLWCFGILGG